MLGAHNITKIHNLFKDCVTEVDKILKSKHNLKTVSKNNSDMELIEGTVFYLTDSFSEEEIASFKLIEMPGCCGICISTKALVNYRCRRKGIGTLLNRFRKELVQLLGYGVLICTDLEDNDPQKKILDSEGFQHIYSFINPRTKNRLNISVYDFTKKGGRGIWKKKRTLFQRIMDKILSFKNKWHLEQSLVKTFLITNTSMKKLKLGKS